MPRFFSFRLGWLALASVSTYSVVEVAAATIETIERTYAAGPDHELVLEADAADITITAADRSDIAFVMTWEASTENAEKAAKQFKRLEFSEEVSDDEIELILETKNSGWRFLGLGSKAERPKVTIEIEVPRRLTLEVDLVSDRLEVEGVAGDHDLDTVSAELIVSGAAGDLELETVSGDLTITASPGDHEIESTSGDIRVRDGEGDLEVESVSGDVLIEGFPGNHEIESVSGDITASLGATLTRDLRFETVSGNIALTVPDALAARFVLASVSGDLETDLGAIEDLQQERRRLSFRRGDASHTLSLQTVSGDIRLRPGGGER
ncbi:MAG: DUF4097 family beta strand repeat-containing protein [Opitutales bacterium]